MVSAGVSHPPGETPLQVGEYPFTIGDFRQIAAALRADVGIMLVESKAPLVYSRLVKRLRALGLESFKDYCTLIATNAGADERRRMMTALTTNVTRFFREPHHFEHLKTEVLPALIDRARKGGRVRLWSAGCSTGEEPYSIALTILAAVPDMGRHDLKILATDIDPDVLDRARRGVYTDAGAAPIEDALRERWFKPAVSELGIRGWEATPQLKALISFREHNLIGDWPMSGPFDAVFCRNTVIYFEEEVQDRIWSRFAPLMKPCATLYVGHSERVTGTEAFQPIGLTAYQRLEDR